MATSVWTETRYIPSSRQRDWVEKYRAALIETNPRAQLERIEEAYEAIQLLYPSQIEAYEREAIEDAQLILSLLREESLERACSAPWL